MNSRYLPSRGKIDSAVLPRGPSGRPLCRWCQAEIPPGRRRTFCSSNCVHQWKLRSQPDYLRAAVYGRDRGRCSGCGLDTRALEERLRSLGPRARGQLLARLQLPEDERCLWEAHHVKAVCEGGGACGLENLRTLCVRCHKRVTASQQRKR